MVPAIWVKEMSEGVGRVSVARMLRVLHAADLHVGSGFRGLTEGGWPPEVAHATTRAFTALVDCALEEKVDAVVLAGDVFDERERPLAAHLHVFSELERLAAQIPVFVVHGNHDPLGPGQRWPTGVHVFGAAWSEVPLLGAHGEVKARVQGVSFPTRDVFENLALKFKRQGAEPTIGVLHANVGGDVGHAPYAPCTLDDLALAGLDYWALGHVHGGRSWVLPDGAMVAYPGNLQARHAKELGPKGALLVEIDLHSAPRVSTRFVPLDVVRWAKVEIDVGGLAGTEAVVAKALELAQALGAEPSAPAWHVARVVLVGAGPVHAELVRPGASDVLETALREALLPRKVALEQLEVGTRPEVDLGALAALGGYTGELARLVERGELPDVDGTHAEAWAELEAALARAGLPPLDRAALVPVALRHAIDRLSEVP